MKRDATTTISISNLYKRFGEIDAVSDVSIAIKGGEVVGLVGPNGAGKTTALSLLMGHIRPTKGAIRVLGIPILPESAHATHKSIGYVAGDMVLPSSLTGEQYLNFVSGRNSRNDDRYKQLVYQLNPVLNRPIHTLSRGNQQKIALVAALQHNPPILILDEPTSGLDPLMQEVFLKTIKNEAASGTTVIMSSHILSEVSSVCNRIVFMRAGKFIVDQPASSIINQAGKHVIITAPTAERIAKILPEYAQIISHTPRQLRVTLDKSNLKAFMRWLQTKDFSDLIIEDRDLDDVFHELYVEPKRRKRL